MIWFYVMLIIDFIIFQPIRVVVGFTMRFLFKLPLVVLPGRAVIPITQLYALADRRYETLDRQKYGVEDMDSAKFLGMLAYAAPEGSEVAKVERSRVMDLCSPNGGLYRCLQRPYPDDAVPFSNDMLSGFLLAVFRFLPSLTAVERESLRKVWNMVSFSGFPLLTANPAGKKKLFERGHIFAPWDILGSEGVLTALAWLFLGYKVTGERRYLVAYLTMKILNLPTLIFTCPDAQIWCGPVYAYSANNTHSKALIFYTGLKLTRSIFFRHALKVTWKRHGVYNADIALLGGEYFGKPGFKDRAVDLIASTADKGRIPCPQSKRYLSLTDIPPKFVVRSEFIVPPIQRGADYVNERSPVKGDLLDDTYREKRGLDVIFPLWILKKLP